MTQACTIAAGNTVLTASGSPLRPSQTTKNTSRTPVDGTVLQIGQHVHPELRRLPATGAGPQPQDVSPTVQVDPDRGVERPVADLPVPNLHGIASMKTAA